MPPMARKVAESTPNRFPNHLHRAKGLLFVWEGVGSSWTMRGVKEGSDRRMLQPREGLAESEGLQRRRASSSLTDHSTGVVGSSCTGEEHKGRRADAGWVGGTHAGLHVVHEVNNLQHEPFRLDLTR
jgi:hypothetical protein